MIWKWIHGIIIQYNKNKTTTPHWELQKLPKCYSKSKSTVVLKARFVPLGPPWAPTVHLGPFLPRQKDHFLDFWAGISSDRRPGRGSPEAPKGLRSWETRTPKDQENHWENNVLRQEENLSSNAYKTCRNGCFWSPNRKRCPGILLKPLGFLVPGVAFAGHSQNTKKH